jgi:SAM-dependent methyltransferase
MNKQQLRDLYVSYHQEKGKYGRKTGGGERVDIVRNFIGTGKKILDLGCRDGNFTKFYTEGNEVVGADIDDVALDLLENISQGISYGKPLKGEITIKSTRPALK